MQAPVEQFTLKQVADSIRKTIESRYNRTYWVTAEMHKLNQTKKGHCYPELVQKENEQIVAEMRGTIWKNSFERIQQRFMEIVKEPLRDGLQLLFQVRIVYHPIYNLGLEIIDIDPNYALGALQRERQETLERLNREGILNANQQIEMALLPKRLAVISQADSKGYSDFRLLLNGHPKKYHFNAFLFEATLQGDAAIPSIIAQLNRIERVKHHFDAVIIIRGGGGEIGMHCYNNYNLAKAIATFPLPVLTGIGHSTNMTVCEMVAFRNGITPSDMAYFLLRIFEELDEPLDESRVLLPGLVQYYFQQTNAVFSQNVERFRQTTHRNLREHQVSAGTILNHFHRVTTLSLQQENHSLSGKRKELSTFSKQLFQQAHMKLESTKVMTGIHSTNQLKRQQQLIETSVNRLRQAGPGIAAKSLHQLQAIERNLNLVDPIHVLRRGYAIVTTEKGLISQSNPPKKGDEIRIIQADITVIAETKEIEKKA